MNRTPRSGSSAAISELLWRGTGDLDGVFGGWGGRYLVDELKRGACGLMSGCHLVDAQVRVYEALQAGDEETARLVFYRQLPAQTLWSLLGLGLAKEILRRRGIFATTECRRSVVPRENHHQEVPEYVTAKVRQNGIVIIATDEGIEGVVSTDATTRVG